MLSARSPRNPTEPFYPEYPSHATMPLPPVMLMPEEVPRPAPGVLGERIPARHNTPYAGAAAYSDAISSTMSSPSKPETSLHSARTAESGLQRVIQMYPHGRTRQVNCVFLGRQGNGKSSLINTIYQTITDSNDNLCEVGYGHESKTMRYACCAELDLKRLLPLIFFDTKGLSDTNDKAYRELLTTILKGRFKPNHSMKKPKWTDCHVLPDYKTQVDVVVFVYAYGTPFPQRLAEAIAAVARECEVPVIPVITHYDQVKDPESLRRDEERCCQAFNTAAAVSLANLNALRINPFTMDLDALALQERQIEFAKATVVDLISQIMLSGQKHQKALKLNPKRPVYSDKCRMM